MYFYRILVISFLKETAPNSANSRNVDWSAVFARKSVATRNTIVICFLIQCPKLSLTYYTRNVVDFYWRNWIGGKSKTNILQISNLLLTYTRCEFTLSACIMWGDLRTLYDSCDILEYRIQSFATLVTLLCLCICICVTYGVCCSDCYFVLLQTTAK